VNYNQRESGTDCTDTNIISDLNNHLCTVSLLKYLIENNLPRKKDTAKVFSLRKTTGITYILDTNPSSSTDSTPRGKIGRFFLFSKVCKMAICCNIKNAIKFTGRSALRGSISKMATSGVASGESLGHSQHKSVRINTVYQTRNTETANH
jgi:hypothetical protein